MFFGPPIDTVHEMSININPKSRSWDVTAGRDSPSHAAQVSHAMDKATRTSEKQGTNPRLDSCHCHSSTKSPTSLTPNSIRSN